MGKYYIEIIKPNIIEGSELHKALQSEFVLAALAYSAAAHEKVNQTYDGHPYSLHLGMVVDYVCKYSYMVSGETDLKNCLAAAFAHDTIEDARQTYNDVKKVLGEQVADIVYACTNEKGKTREERQNEQYYRLLKSTVHATFIKICDRLANCLYSRMNNTGMLQTYRKEQASFRKNLWAYRYNEMFLELDQILFY